MAMTASAQYNPSAELVKKGGKLYIDGTKLSKEQVSNILASYSDERGTAYNELWSKANGMRKGGIALTSAGSAAIVIGPVVTLIGAIVGAAEGIGAGLGAGLSAALGGTEAQPAEVEATKGKGIVVSGVVVTGAGVAMLGSGIPLLCIGNKRMKNIVSGYNAQLPATARNSEVAIALGPCPNGIGLSISF